MFSGANSFLNPTALRRAKTLLGFGCSVCNRIKEYNPLKELCCPGNLEANAKMMGKLRGVPIHDKLSIFKIHCTPVIHL